MNNANKLTNNERVERLQSRLVERLQERPWFLSRPILLVESLRHTEGEPVHRRRAKAFAHLLTCAPIEIAREEAVVGSHPGERPADVDEKSLGAARAYMASLSAAHQFQRFHLTPAERLALEEGIIHHVGWRDSHLIVDYPKILRLGFDGLRRETCTAKATVDEPGKDFLDSVLTTLDAAVEFIRRYAQLAREENLSDAAERCKWVSRNPPCTFAQALQLYWFTHLLVAFEEGGWGYSFGRFDQYLIDFYRRDVAAGRLSREGAMELIQCFWIKINENQVTGDSRTLNSKNLTVGGLGEDGSDATNELTYLAHDATETLRLRLPNLSVRVHSGSPGALWERIARLIQAGIGQPQVYNDDVMVPSLTGSISIPTEVARSYAVQGCIETNIPGQCAPWMDCGLNLPGCLLLALDSGRSWRTRMQVGPPTPPISERSSFNDLLAAYDAQVDYFAHMLSEARYRFDNFQPGVEAVPFCSALISDCVSRGRDAYNGGARHKWAGVYCVGPATITDSLLVLKRFLNGGAPKDQRLSTLREALRSNFASHSSLHAWAAGLPSYGNDNDEVDLLAKHVCASVCEAILGQRADDGARLLPMLSSHTLNVRFGQVTPATPDGRLAGEPLSNVMSPSYGRDRLGPTAVIRSATKIDYTKSPGGSILNLKFVPVTLAGAEGRAKLASLLKTYFMLGGHQVQVNFVDQKTLLDAQANPQRHESLVVRISGFCAKFVCLDRDLQDEIIRRTAHSG